MTNLSNVYRVYMCVLLLNLTLLNLKFVTQVQMEVAIKMKKNSGVCIATVGSHWIVRNRKTINPSFGIPFLLLNSGFKDGFNPNKQTSLIYK